MSYSENPVRCAPSCSKKNSVCSPSNESFITKFCGLARYASLLTVVASKKERPMLTFLRYGAEHVHLRKSCARSSIARGCSVTLLRELCLLILQVMWKAALLLIRLSPTSPAFGYKSLRELICRCLSNAIERDLMQAFSYHLPNGC